MLDFIVLLYLMMQPPSKKEHYVFFAFHGLRPPSTFSFSSPCSFLLNHVNCDSMSFSSSSKFREVPLKEPSPT
ncbi:hypothetical protein QL285_097344 [Trifolium repens]|nr:hypothetical protein QL285_097344 [Trifolium repens]